jgi:regulator of sirC expression with transglutaminase-like and TPR domain
VIHTDTSFALFRAAVARPEEEIDLLEASLLIAQAEYPMLDRDACRARVEEIAGEAGEAFAADSLARLLHLNRLLFQKLGFHGNEADYYDPRNSFLNDVLERRTGIPISLALLYIEIGRRLGLPLVGVGLPGHFLVGCMDRFDVFVDVFFRGKLMTRTDCIAWLRELRPELQFRSDYLAPVGTRAFLTRLLNNLLEIYLRTSRYQKALPMLERIIALNPDDAEYIRRRGYLHYALKNFAAAARDIERCLALDPNSPDRQELTEQLGLLHQLRGMVN